MVVPAAQFDPSVGCTDISPFRGDKTKVVPAAQL